MLAGSSKEVQAALLQHARTAGLVDQTSCFGYWRVLVPGQPAGGISRETAGIRYFDPGRLLDAKWHIKT